jgi:thiamine pyrophosphate-dependent acetolactate synthase large subunit-like protein
MQEDPLPNGKAPPIPHLPRIIPPVGEETTIAEIARLLIESENPVIFADRVARTPAGLAHMIELAELLQAAVCDSGNRFNFPWRHPLNQTQRQATVIAEADLVLELEPGDPFSVSTTWSPTGATRSLMRPGTKRITISSIDLYAKSNYQDAQRFPPDIDIAVAADAEATLPSLIEAIKRKLSTTRKRALRQRGVKLAQYHNQELERSRVAASYGWDARPISTGRLFAELYAQIRQDDWSLLSTTDFQSHWAQQLWTADKHSQYIGASGGYGVGYLGPATLGAALANRKHGRLSVAVNGDGDMMMGPGILWTAANSRIPLLYIIHNNRAYHMELMLLQFVANRRQRGIDRTHIGCELTNPAIDWAGLGRSLGVYSEGPIEDPADLGPALQRAIAQVRKGEPALVDVVAQGR